MIQRILRPRIPGGLCLILAAALAAGASLADTAVLPAELDTMILEEDISASNGAGDHFCVGGNASPSFRRGLIRFDLSSIPAGSSVTAVTLDLYENNAGSNGSGTFDLHRVTSEWGEGSSDAISGECQGAPGQLGDASWFYRYYDPPASSIFWNTFGGDFDGTASASLFVNTSSGHKLWSSPQLVNDVQDWLDAAEPNYGWLLKRSTESGTQTALRFASRTNPTPSQRPALIPGHASN